MAGVKLQMVHYRGSAPAVQDLVAGTMDVAFDNVGAAGALVKGGTIRALGLTSENPLPAFPGVPVVKDTVPGFVVVTWFALVAPPKTPQAIVNKLHADINEALRDAEVRKRLGNLSADVGGGSLADTAAFFKKEVETWHNVIKQANVKLEQ
jgi:tripartite-type tricarboxylate transporter receptor subunit TctC